jgi:hypothetical protein
MKRLGFDSRWIRLVMMCVKSVQYAIVVNEVPCGHINPTRGIRQGDPISPYLFLICAEVLSSMVTQANQDGALTGVPTSKRGPRVSHLFFADDSLLFCRANLSQWDILTRLLYGNMKKHRANVLTIIRQLFILAGIPWWWKKLEFQKFQEYLLYNVKIRIQVCQRWWENQGQLLLRG